jgi:SAM-dependent methyltransferase
MHADPGLTKAPLPWLEIDPNWKILEVGSGPNRLFPRSTVLDVRDAGRPDVLHDLNVVPYPLPDSSFDLIVCVHVLEHVDRLVEAIGELHRLLKPGGRLFVEVPYFTSAHFFSDPTHRHAFTTRSFDYFVEGTPVSAFGYSGARFEKERVEIVVPGNGVASRWIRRWINSHHRTYEERLAFVFPRHTLQFLLRAVK